MSESERQLDKQKAILVAEEDLQNKIEVGVIRTKRQIKWVQGLIERCINLGMSIANEPEKARVSATCNCTKDVELNGYDGKDMTSVKIPDNITLRYNAPGRAVRESVAIDTCLVPEIKFLWALGIETTGCCCGHGIEEGQILVAKKDIPKMEVLGYEHWENPMDPERKDGFVAMTSNLKQEPI